MMQTLRRRWFSVESKSFEIKVEGEDRKERVIISERRKGRRSWIRFGEGGIRILLKGVESFRREAGKKSVGVEWWENERRYTLEVKENGAGRFIQCSVDDEDGKRHRLFFPEGDGLVNGWTLLEEALQDLCFKRSRGEGRKPTTSNICGKMESTMGDQIKKQPCADTRAAGNYQDALWLDISDYILKGDLRMLKDGVVGSWKSKSTTNTISSEMEAWAKKAWRLKGNVFFHSLNQNLFFMGFDLTEEADWVMENGSRICRGEAMLLERWTPSTGCMRSNSQNQEAWIRVFGLPLHLWTEEILVKIGDSCGGFVAMDKETSLMENFHWARILVKREGSGRPTIVNLLAEARSYEIQLWWEIQPRVTEVYPCRNKRETEMVNLVVEDEGKPRAAVRVTANRETRRHNPQVVQEKKGQLQALCRNGTKDSLSQNLKCAGDIPQRQFKTALWERREEEGNLLLSPGRHQWDVMGQSPSGSQGVRASQSPRQIIKANRPTVPSINENQKPEIEGMRVEKSRGTGSPKITKFHSSSTPGDVEEGVQNKRSTQNQGQINYNTSRDGANRKERRSWMEVGGRQSDKNDCAYPDSDWSQIYGMATRDVQIYEDSKSEEDDGNSYRGEKNRISFPFTVGKLNSDVGRDVKAGRGTKGREESSPASQWEEAGVEISQAGEKGHSAAERLGQVVGMRTMVENKVKRLFSTQQEKEDFGPGQLSLIDGGAGEGNGANQEEKRAQGKELVLGRPNRLGPGPKPGMRSPFNVLGSCGNIEGKATEKEAERRQEIQLRSSLQQNHKCSCSGDTVGVHSKEIECPNIHRYDDNISVQSTSAMISVFGRPLLQGEISGLGGINGEEDLEPLRVVAADGREWGADFSGVLFEEGEGLVVAGSRSSEEQNEASEPWTYERWENSCLAKFSDFLGFPTKGFEKEITNLLRNLVNAQKVGKGKECQSLSKSERELKKLKWTINYKGKETCREDGRDRG